MMKIRITICLMFIILSAVAQNDSTIIARSSKSNSRVGDEIYFSFNTEKIKSVSVVNKFNNRYNSIQYKTYSFIDSSLFRSVYLKTCDSCDSMLVSSLGYNKSELGDTLYIIDGDANSTITENFFRLKYGLDREEKYTIVESDTSLLLLDFDNVVIRFSAYFSKDTIVILDKYNNNTTLIYDQKRLKSILLDKEKEMLIESDTLFTQYIQFTDEGFFVSIDDKYRKTNIVDIFAYIYLTNLKYELFPILIALAYKNHIDMPLELFYISIH